MDLNISYVQIGLFIVKVTYVWAHFGIEVLMREDEENMNGEGCGGLVVSSRL